MPTYRLALLALALSCTAPEDSGTDAGSPLDAGVFDDAGTDPDVGPLELAAFASAWTAAFCEGFARCGEGSAAFCLEWIARGGADSLRIDSPLRAADAAARGEARFDGTRARTCVEAVRTRTCEEWRSVLACEETFTGVVAKGDRCSSRASCVAGLTCRSERGGACDATCEEPFEPCLDDRDCGAGEECAFGSRRCEPVRSPGTEGLPCGSFDRCAAGLGCFEEAGAWTCRAFGSEGPACDRTKACGPGLTCSSTPDFYFRCVAPIAEGGSCADFEEACAPGLSCVRESATIATCRAPKAVGDPCTRTTECGLGSSATRELFCDRASGLCARLPATGPCEAAHCDPRVAFCDLLQADPTCVPYKPAGAECLLEDECGPRDSAWICGDSRVCERGTLPACE